MELKKLYEICENHKINISNIDLLKSGFTINIMEKEIDYSFYHDIENEGYILSAVFVNEDYTLTILFAFFDKNKTEKIEVVNGN